MRGLKVAGKVIGWVVLVALMLVCATVLTVLVAVRTDWGHRRVLGLALPAIQKQLRGRLQVGRVDGDLTRTLVLEDVELDDAAGEPAVRVRRLALRYDLLGLVRHTLDLDEVDVEGGWVHARVLPDGTLNLATLTVPSKTPAQPSRWTVDAARVVAEVVARYDGLADARGPARTIRGVLHLVGRAHVAGGDVDATIDGLRAETTLPLAATLRGHGEVRLRGGALSADGLALALRADGAELRKLAPSVALRGPWNLKLTANGPAKALALTLVLEPPAGLFTVDARLRGAPAGGRFALDTLAWQATARARGLDPAAAVAGAPPGDVRLDARAHGHGAQGTVELEALTASVAGTHVAAHGTVDSGGDARLWAELSSPDLSRLAAVGVRGLGGRLEARGRVEKSARHLHVDADASGAALALGGNRVGQLDAHVHAHDFIGEAHVQAQRVRAAGVRLDTLALDASGTPRTVALSLDARGPDRTTLALVAHGTPTTVRHPGGIGGVAITGADLTIDQLAMARGGQRWAATAPAELHLHHTVALAGLTLAAGAQRLALDGRYTPANGAIDATVRAAALDVASLVHLARPGLDVPRTSLALTARLHGTRRAPLGELSVAGTSAPWPRFGLGRARYQVDARYGGDRVRAQLALAAGGQSLAGRVDLPTTLAGRHALLADLRFGNVALAALAPLLPSRLAALRGQVDGTLALSGTTTRPVLETTVHARGVDLSPAARNSDLQVKLSYRERRLDGRAELRLLQGAFGKNAGVVVAQVALPLDAAFARLRRPERLLERLQHKTPIAAVVTLQGLDAARFPYAALGLTPPLRAGRVDGSFKLRGTLDAPLVDVDVEGHGLARGKLDRIEVVAAADYIDRQATLKLDAWLRGQPALRLRGRSGLDLARILDREPWKQAPLTVDAEVPGYDLALLQDLAPNLAGRLRATAEVRGTIARPTGKLDASAAGLRMASMRYDRFEAHGTFDGKQASGRLDAHEVTGGALAADARVPVAAGQPLYAVVRAHGFQVDIENGLTNPRLLKGKLDAMLDVNGPRANPTVKGYVRFGDGQLALATEARIYKDIQLDVAINGDWLKLKRLDAKLGEGTLTANGEAKLAGLRPEELTLRAYARKFPIPTGTFGAWIDADLTVRGHKTPGGLSGTITVDKGTARLPKIAGGKKLQKLGPLEDVRFVDARAKQDEARRKEAAGRAPTVEAVAHIPGPFHVRSKEISTDLKGDLRIEVAGPVTRLNGHVESTGGWVELVGRRYTIDKARIGFAGRPEPDPELDIRLTRQLSETTLVIEVHGTAKKPKLVLESDPPIYDQSQVVMAILSGDPAAQRVDNRSLDQKVTGAVSSLIVGKIKDQIAPNLPIDVIKVDTGSEGATGLGDTRLEIGKFITDTIYVSYIHQFGSTLVGTQRRNANEANLEWRFKKHYELETAFGDAAVGRVNFYWTIRY